MCCRWSGSLDPRLNKRPWTDDEVAELLRLAEELQHAWGAIASALNTGRSELAVRNQYYSHRRFLARHPGVSPSVSTSSKHRSAGLQQHADVAVGGGSGAVNLMIDSQHANLDTLAYEIQPAWGARDTLGNAAFAFKLEAAPADRVESVAGTKRARFDNSVRTGPASTTGTRTATTAASGSSDMSRTPHLDSKLPRSLSNSTGASRFKLEHLSEDCADEIFGEHLSTTLPPVLSKQLVDEHPSSRQSLQAIRSRPAGVFDVDSQGVADAAEALAALTSMRHACTT